MAWSWQGALSHPLTLLGAGMMAGADPKRTGFGGIGAGILQAERRLGERDVMAEEMEMNRRLADLQAQTYQARLAQAGQPKLGQTPLYFREPGTGKLRIGRFGPEGIQFPETAGMEAVKPVQTIGIGGQELILPYGAEQPTGIIERTLSPEAEPVTRARQAEAVEMAKSQTAAKIELPDAAAKAQQVNKDIDELINHPGLESGTGKSAMLPVIPGSDRMDFELRRKQLVGQTFLQALNEMRAGGGVGQITEIEGEKAQAAIARMESATKKEDFIQALEDYRAVVNSALERKKRQAKGKTQQEGVVDWSEL